MYSLKKASEATGRGKPAILKAIQKGRISAKKDDNGQWRIDPSELHRVYPPVPGTASETGSGERRETAEKAQGNSLLEREVELLRERLEDKDAVIDDLRARLDKEAEERRTLSRQLLDLRERPAPEQPRAPGWWDRLLGRA